jgi:hypothetical protein
MSGLVVYVVVMVTEESETPVLVSAEREVAYRRLWELRNMQDQGFLHPNVKGIEARVVDIAEAMELSRQAGEREAA